MLVSQKNIQQLQHSYVN